MSEALLNAGRQTLMLELQEAPALLPFLSIRQRHCTATWG